MVLRDGLDPWMPQWMENLLLKRFEKGFVGMATTLDQLLKKLVLVQRDATRASEVNPSKTDSYVSARNKIIVELSKPLYEMFWLKYNEVKKSK